MALKVSASASSSAGKPIVVRRLPQRGGTDAPGHGGDLLDGPKAPAGDVVSAQSTGEQGRAEDQPQTAPIVRQKLLVMAAIQGDLHDPAGST